MSQFLCPSMTSKNYLMTNKDMSSSHPIFWSSPPTTNLVTDRRRSDFISWSYPPKNFSLTQTLSAKLSEFSSKIANFNPNLNSNSFRSPLKNFDQLLSTQVLRRMAHKDMECAIDPCYQCVLDGQSSAVEELLCPSVCPTADQTSTKIQINDSKVLDSMQNDRQKKKKRKRRRPKRRKAVASSAANKSLPPMDCSVKQCFSVSFDNSFVSFLLDSESDDYDSEEDGSSVEEMSLCTELELMCNRLFFDNFFFDVKSTQSTPKTGTDETDCSSAIIVSDQSNEEESALEESIRRANERWSSSHWNVTEERSPARVRFSDTKPSVRVIVVWDYASRRARCGQWEQMARDRDRFAEKCRRIESQIGWVFNKEHRQKVYDSRFS